MFADVLAGVWERCSWTVHAYCPMTITTCSSRRREYIHVGLTAASLLPTPPTGVTRPLRLRTEKAMWAVYICGSWRATWCSTQFERAWFASPQNGLGAATGQ
jgi:hypothetical protein